ncbi:ROK family protein [Pseudonocardia xishanensis]
MGERVLGIDVGGTKIASGLVDPAGRTEQLHRVRVEGRGEQALAQVVAVARGYLERHPVAAVGVAVPGGVDPVSRTVVAAPNLGWTGLDLAGLLRAELGCAVTVENDGNAAAWAEHRFGAGAGSATTVLVTVGTGLGCGLVLGGRLHTGDRGLGGELGHLLLVPDGRACVCGSRGCWEQYASGSALAAEARDRGWSAAPFTAEDVLDAAAADPVAAEVVDRVASRLAHGLTVLGACFDAGRILLGGGLGTDPRFLGRVRAGLERIAPPSAVRTPVVVEAAALGVAAGVIGAADLAAAGFDRNVDTVRADGVPCHISSSRKQS